MSRKPSGQPTWRARALAVAVAVLTGTASTGTALAASPGAPAGQAAVKRVYLTFDDGPSPRYTQQILAVLARYGAHATFFELGQNVAAYPSLTHHVHAMGDSVQNHTWSHPDLRHVSGPTFTYQVTATDRAIRAQTNTTPRYLRPPYGSLNSTVRERAAALGKTIELWTVDPRDWARPGAAAIERRVLDNVRPGSVVLMHDGGGDRSQTVAALPTILHTLTSRGYTFALLH